MSFGGLTYSKGHCGPMGHPHIHGRVPLSSGAPAVCVGRVSPTEATPEWDTGAEDLNHGRSRTQPKNTRAAKPRRREGRRGEGRKRRKRRRKNAHQVDEKFPRMLERWTVRCLLMRGRVLVLCWIITWYGLFLIVWNEGVWRGAGCWLPKEVNSCGKRYCISFFRLRIPWLNKSLLQNNKKTYRELPVAWLDVSHLFTAKPHLVTFS